MDEPIKAIPLRRGGEIFIGEKSMENKIKEIRANTGLSQARFGEAYHIPKRTVQDWESTTKEREKKR